MKYVELRTGATADSARTGDDLEEDFHVLELLAHRVGERGVVEVGFEAERLPNRRIAVEVTLQLEKRASGENPVDVGLSDGLRMLTPTTIEPVLTVRREGAGFVSDSLRDGLLAKSGLGRRAGAASHTRKSPRTIDKSSPSHVPNSTTSATGEVIA